MVTKAVKIKNVTIGGGSPVSVQSMLSCDTLDREAVAAQIDALQKEGCQIIRLAVENEAAVEACREYLAYAQVPLVADIHFDYKLAVLCAEAGFPKIRINPGNIGSSDKVKAVVDACRANKTVIRVGVNGGSLERDLRIKYGATAEALAESALRAVAAIEKFGFDGIVVSAKSSDLKTLVEANRLISQRCNYPLHIGLTESGSGTDALVKSSMGIGMLLMDGIGDTIRVSLTAHPVEEVRAAKAILKALGIRKGCEVISCPTCSRCKYGLVRTAEAVKEMTADIDVPLKIAVMGCAVNGPGEASEADLGVAGCGNGRAVLFKKGKVIKTVDENQILPAIKAMIEELR